jgi:YVTN family beta-propeller protein
LAAVIVALVASPVAFLANLAGIVDFAESHGIGRYEAPTTTLPPLVEQANIPVPAIAGPLLIEGGSLWVASFSYETGRKGDITRIDAATKRPVKYLRVGARPKALAFGHGSVWVANKDDETLTRIDPSTSRVTATIRLGFVPSSLVASTDAIWVGDDYRPRVARLDPSTNHVVASIRVGSGDETTTGITEGFGSLWVSVSGRGLVRLNSQSGREIAAIPGADGSALLAASGSMWSANLNTVARIDPTDNVVISWTPLEGTASDLVTDGTWLWVPQTYGPIARIDPLTARVTKVYGTPEASTDRRVIAAPGGLWVTDNDTVRFLQTA